MMSPTKLFEYLGVPLRNFRSSWGGSNEYGVVMRVWQDQSIRVPGGKRGYQIYQDGDQSRPGGSERLKHFAEIKDGKPFYVVVCQDAGSGKGERKIRQMKEWPIFACEQEMVDIDGKTHVVITKRLHQDEVRSRLGGHA